MKNLSELVLEEQIKYLLESFYNPDLNECKLIDDKSKEFGYKLYLTPHGSKRSHRNQDEGQDKSLDYSKYDIIKYISKGYKQIINFYENANCNFKTGNANELVNLKTSDKNRNFMSLNILCYLHSKTYDVNNDKIIYNICVHNAIWGDNAFVLNNGVKKTKKIILKENIEYVITIIEI